MTRSHRVRLSVLPGIAAGLVLTFGLLPGAISVTAQSDDAAPPPPISSDDDQAPDAVDWSDDVPAHIAVVDGAVWLERDGHRDAADENVPLLAGDRVITDRGRGEILFSDGSALDLDEQTSVDLLSGGLLRLQRGRLRLTLVRSTSAPVDFRVDASGTTTMFRAAGEYRVTADGLGGSDARVTVAVIRGSAEIGSPYGRTLVRPGYEAAASASAAPSAPYVTSVAAWDEFDRWADNLWQDRVGVQSARYLPEEVRPYGGVFDRYGTWEMDASYGYVWYPRVDTGWRPYYTGAWSYVGPFGWFWVGADRWSWPTHHYGRWGYRNTRWYWIPDRRWAPAWVSWASAPGYLSWCPLGYNNRPLISIGVGYSSWHAWTVVPVTRVVNTRIVVNGRSRTTFPSSARFVERRGAPIRPAVSVRVDRQPLRAPSYTSRASYAGARTATRDPIPRDNRPDARPSRAIDPRRDSGDRPASTPASPGRSADWRTSGGGSRTPQTTGPRTTAPRTSSPSWNTQAPARAREPERADRSSTPAPNGVPQYRAPESRTPSWQAPRAQPRVQREAPPSPAPVIPAPPPRERQSRPDVYRGGSSGAPYGGAMRSAPRAEAPRPSPPPERRAESSSPRSGGGERQSSGGGERSRGSSGGSSGGSNSGGHARARR
jgi:uncharacterized membrane protein YgcG